MSGGGFYGGGDSNSQANASGAKKYVKPIRSLMIRQVKSASLEFDNPDGPVVIDGHIVGNAVLCVELLDIHEAGNNKRLSLADRSGMMELRIPPFGPDPTEFEGNINQFGYLYGHFRVFQGKPTFDFSRFDFQIHPYQFLYHEIEVAREIFHYQGIVPIGTSSSGPKSEDPIKGGAESKPANVSEALFVGGDAKPDDELTDRILGIIQGFEDSGDGVTTDYIAAELSLEEAYLRNILSRLESEGKTYEIDGSWRAN